jgi:hypothetical protein
MPHGPRSRRGLYRVDRRWNGRTRVGPADRPAGNHDPTVETSSNTFGPGANKPQTYLTGRAGVNVHVVVVVLGDGRQVQTSLWDRGWFAAWWPGDDKRVQLLGYDAGGVRITAP